MITDLGIRQRVCNPAPSLTSFVCFVVVVVLPLIVLLKQTASMVMFIHMQTDGHSLGHNGEEITMIKKTCWLHDDWQLAKYILYDIFHFDKLYKFNFPSFYIMND